MKLDYWNRWFRFQCAKEQSEVAKKAGFFLDKRGFWLTRDIFAARRVAHYGDTTAREAIEKHRVEANRNIHNSFAVDAPDFDIPAPNGQSYLAYQRAGIAYASERERTLIGDEMGLGKTIQAIGLINLLRPGSVLIVCPASLKLNWRDELRKWIAVPLTYGVATPSYWPLSDVVIVNYELLKKCRKAIHKRRWELLIGDEIHYVKNKDTVRAQEFMDVPHHRALGLTGTPVPNRPLELFPILHWLRPHDFPSYRAFKQRYEGGSNSEELQSRLRSSVMVRRLKSEVLKDLPAKRRQIIELPLSNHESVVMAELKAWADKERTIEGLKQAVEVAKKLNNKEEYRRAVNKLRAEVKVAFAEMSKYRKATALAKLPYIIEHLEDCIENEEKVICFCLSQGGDG